MYERLLAVIAVAIFGYVTYFILRRSQLQRAQSALLNKNGVQLKAHSHHIVYFWSEGCSQCKNSQKPTLDKLMETLKQRNVELVSIRVEDNVKLVNLWGVKTLPTTYVIDQQGKVSHVNNGLVSGANIIVQLNLG